MSKTKNDIPAIEVGKPIKIEAASREECADQIAELCKQADGLTREQVDEQMEEARKQVNSELATYEQVALIKLYPHEFEKTPKKSIKRFLYTNMV